MTPPDDGLPQADAQSKPLRSQLLNDDPSLRDLVEEFVANLATRVTQLRAAHDQLEWQQLQTLAHQLKGAGGSFGYPDISKLGATMETAFKKQEAAQFTAWMNELADLIASARAGLEA